MSRHCYDGAVAQKVAWLAEALVARLRAEP